MKSINLNKLDGKIISDNLDEIRVFSVVQNEKMRLPYFLEHHRKLGANRFFFIDNNSSDGTTELLLDQPDCHVFFTTDEYAKAKSGIDWTNHLLNIYGTNRWCLVLDADELLVYPHCEKIKLKSLCDYLDQEGSETFFTFLIDMYPQKSLSESHYQEGSPFLKTASCFDKEYHFVDRITLNKNKKLFPQQEVLGGPRERCFFNEQGAKSFLKRLMIHVISRALYKLRAVGLPIPVKSLKAPVLFKLPLVKWKTGKEFLASTHEVTSMPLSKTISGALLHFKFFSDFHDRAITAVKNNQHVDHSHEYRRYLSHFDSVKNLYYNGSVHYESSQTLLDYGLIKSNTIFNRMMMKNRVE